LFKVLARVRKAAYGPPPRVTQIEASNQCASPVATKVSTSGWAESEVVGTAHCARKTGEELGPETVDGQARAVDREPYGGNMVSQARSSSSMH
jgi:hypothetical protein